MVLLGRRMSNVRGVNYEFTKPLMARFESVLLFSDGVMEKELGIA